MTMPPFAPTVLMELLARRDRAVRLPDPSTEKPVELKAAVVKVALEKSTPYFAVAVPPPGSTTPTSVPRVVSIGQVESLRPNAMP